MRVKCILCDTVNEIDDDCPEAKKIRNKPLHTYMCETCHERITEKTQLRKEIADQQSEAPL